MKQCSLDGCIRKHRAKGLCNNHYNQMKHYRKHPLNRKSQAKSSDSNGEMRRRGRPKGRVNKFRMLDFKAYGSWQGMFTRCFNPRSPFWYRYGGRGITICERWQGKEGFKNFLEDMGERPEGLSIDRIDNNGNYEPSNCRWATNQQQAFNREYKRARNKYCNISFVKRSRNYPWKVAILHKNVFVINQTFATVEEAIKARNSCWEKYGLEPQPDRVQ